MPGHVLKKTLYFTTKSLAHPCSLTVCIIHRKLNLPRFPLATVWIIKLYPYTMKMYSCVKKNEIMKFAVKSKLLENIS